MTQSTSAQDQASTTPTPAPPRIQLARPLIVSLDEPTSVVLRGWQLPAATHVEASPASHTIRIVQGAPASIPARQDAKEIGDSQLEIELTPAKMPSENPAAAPSGSRDRGVEVESRPAASAHRAVVHELQLVVVGPTGRSEPYTVRLLPSSQFQHEVEPNDAVEQAAVIRRSLLIVGQIHQERDVDVFEIQGNAGDRWSVHAVSSDRGTACDPLVIILSSHGEVLRQADDQPPSRDVLLEFELPPDGRAWVSLLDAHDRGGPAHPYYLELRKLP